MQGVSMARMQIGKEAIVPASGINAVDKNQAQSN